MLVVALPAHAERPPHAGQSATTNLTVLGGPNVSFSSPVNYEIGATCDNSVAVADVNGDGKPDLVVASGCYESSLGVVSVLLGNGDGTFQSPATYNSGGGFATSVAITDVNGDGKPDVLVGNGCAPVTNCSTEGGVVGVLLGNGDGTFMPARVFDSGGSGFYGSYLAVADLNGDGKPDIVVTTQGTLGVLLGNGDGSFQAAMTFSSGGIYSYAVAVGDVNGDGKSDVIVPLYTFDTESSVSVLLGNGDGSLQPPLLYDAGEGAIGATLADLNHDGHLDIAVADNSSNTVSVLLGNGDGTFHSPISYPSGGELPFGIAAADINEDGKLDLVVANCSIATNRGYGCPSRKGSVGILLGNGDGTFQPTVAFYTGGGLSLSSGLAVADLNGDGKPDLAVTNNPGASNSSIGVLLNQTKIGTSTSLISTLNPSIYGQNVTLTATVTGPGSTPPSGSVSFRWSNRTIATVPLDRTGVASITRNNLNADPYPMVAVYLGDATYGTSTSSVVNQTVLQATSSATLTSSPNPSSMGQSVMFMATISSPTAKPTGPVTFTAGKTVLGTVQLKNGKATLTTSALPEGSTGITVTFVGDSNIQGSSASVTQVVQ